MSSVCRSFASSSTIGMAIAISAAATTNTRNTSTAPDSVALCAAKVTRLRITPFSISSMHISITSALRRTMTPISPRANRAIETVSSSCVLSIVPPPGLDHGDRGDHGREQQHGSELEVQPVTLEEFHREGLHLERGAGA